MLLLCGSCSVADNLSYGQIVDELDGIVRIEGAGADRRIAYADRAATSAWYMRWFLLVPIRPVLGFLFGDKQEGPIENPAGHVRELIRELPDETGGDLLACANAATRLAWIAEVEGNGQSRIVAIDGPGQRRAAAADRPVRRSAGTHRRASRLGEVRLGARDHRGRSPEARGATPWDDQRLQPYVDAFAVVVANPLEDWVQRLRLLEKLIELYRDERDPRVIPAAASALRIALAHCVRGVLLAHDPGPRSAARRVAALRDGADPAARRPTHRSPHARRDGCKPRATGSQ
jgi:hypothetical protein